MNKAEEILEKHINEDDLNFIFHEKKELWHELLNAVNEALRQSIIRGSLSLDTLRKKVDDALAKETPEKLTEWLEEKRK